MQRDVRNIERHEFRSSKCRRDDHEQERLVAHAERAHRKRCDHRAQVCGALSLEVACPHALESSRVRHAQQDRLSAKQLVQLDDDLRWMMNEDLITHLGNEYY